MPLSLTTLNNAAAVAKTFSEVFKDRTESEFINTTDSVPGGLDVRLNVKQSKVGKAIDGTPIRRSLVKLTISRPVTGGSNPPQRESIVMNFTVTSPEGLTALTSTDRNDALSFIKNFLTEANVAGLVQGML